MQKNNRILLLVSTTLNQCQHQHKLLAVRTTQLSQRRVITVFLMLWIQRFALRCSDPKRPQPQHAHTPSRDQIRCFVNFSILRQFSESSLWYMEGVVHTSVPHFIPQHLFFLWSPVFTATAPQSSVRVQCKRCWMLETSRSLVHSQPGVNAKPQDKRMANERSVAWSETVQPISNRRTTCDTKCTQTADT